jgi:hypothetical protein
MLFATMVAALAAACSRSSAVSLSPVPSATPTPTLQLVPSEIATLVLSALEEGAPSYRDSKYPIAFEYPAAYDLPDYASCAPHLLQAGDSYEVGVGNRTTLSVLPPEGLSLEEYVDKFIEDKAALGEWTLDRRAAADIGVGKAVAGILVDYRFGSTNRFGTATFAMHGDSVYVFGFTAGATCDVPEAGIGETDAYQQMLRTFTFTDRSP